jgi:hypothetical protein
MKLNHIKETLGASVFAGHDKLDMFVEAGFGSDLMSDMLSLSTEGALLLTGLTNVQVLRSSVIAGVTAVVLVRGKQPNQEMIDQAVKHDVPLMATPFTMFTACGKLFGQGLRGIEERGRK